MILDNWELSEIQNTLMWSSQDPEFKQLWLVVIYHRDVAYGYLFNFDTDISELPENYIDPYKNCRELSYVMAPDTQVAIEYFKYDTRDRALEVTGDWLKNTLEHMIEHDLGVASWQEWKD